MMETAPPAPPREPGNEPLTFDRQVLGTAAYVASLPRGPRAVLRRLEAAPEYIPPQVFWDVVERYGIRRNDEDFWLGVLPLMVRHEHRFDRTPGRALAAGGVSAARVERWLRLDANGARSEAGRLFSHLKGEGFDWTRLAPLLRFWTEDERRRFARDFFLSAEYRQRQSQGES